MNQKFDWQTALKALLRQHASSQVIMDYLNELVSAQRLIWLPMDKEIEGSKKTDQLAKRGSDTKMYGPESFLGIPYKTNVKYMVKYLYGTIYVKSEKKKKTATVEQGTI